ncbi:Tether containing UBX domain for GLUT4 [Camponotus japonicus]
MAANKAVTVLAPNGRRQNVKITMNTTILQVLEEVCQKQGFNVDDYDIKHNRQILDPNTTFRFTGVPNNAQLEMVACTKTRSASNVAIAIQSEDGERIMREFSPKTTLAQVLVEIYPDSDLERAILIYMHQEVCGREALEKTTLKSLGLNSGRAILRLMYRDLEQLRTQAHVSVPLLPKSEIAMDNLSSNKDCSLKVPLSVPHCSKTLDDNVSSINVSNIENQKSEAKIDRKSEASETSVLNDKEQEKDTYRIEESHATESSHKDHESGRDQYNTEAHTKVQEDVYEVKFLGERNALVFNQAGTQALPRDELPDNFFELDLHDAQTLLRDAKRRKEQLEDAQLLTEAKRQLDQNKHILDRLNKYRRTVIRIQFPDQFVLQGLFGPLETIEIVKNFIKNYLDDPNCEFVIYTSPPKHILNSDARLIDENLVPSAIVYYSGQSLLRTSVKEKLTDPRAAGIEAIKSRIATTRKEQDPATEEDRSTINESNHVTPGPSGSGKSSSSSSSSARNQNKTPKWFKQAGLK